MNKLNYLDKLIKVYEDNEMESEYVKEHVGYVIESAKWFNEEIDYPEDLDNFDRFLDGCRYSLDFLLSHEEVEKTLQLRDLYEEHFGVTIATEFSKEIRTINEAIIDCFLAMILDYGI